MLGRAVCGAVADLNSRGVLDDTEAIENEFSDIVERGRLLEEEEESHRLRLKEI